MSTITRKISTRTFSDDVLLPEQCLQLVAEGVTNKVPFIWLMSADKTKARLEVRPHPHDVFVENMFHDGVYIPAYSVNAILNYFPEVCINITNGKAEIGLSNNKDTHFSTYVAGNTLRDAAFELLLHALKFMRSPREFNVHLHEYYCSTNYNS